jgi:hypothetical protein
LTAEWTASSSMSAPIDRETILGNARYDSYWIRRRNFVLGKEIRHRSWATDKLLRTQRRALLEGPRA